MRVQIFELVFGTGSGDDNCINEFMREHVSQADRQLLWWMDMHWEPR